MLIKRNVVTLLLTVIAFSLPTLCFAQGATDRVKVVATFSILGDLVGQVGGDRIELATLVGPDGDAHVYSPTPADARRLAEAKVVFTNGLRFEGWIARLIKSSGTKAVIVEASRGVKALKVEEEHGHGHAGIDPHAWQNIANAKLYVAAIRDALVGIDAAGRTAYETNATKYLKALDELEAEVKTTVARIPSERRRIITSHDAFRYFEAAYGLNFIAPQGVSTEAEASAKDVARIIQQIRREKIPAIFIETLSDPRLIERIAKETGAKVGEKVYSDSLSAPGGSAATYIDMMRHNIRAFSAALSS